MTTDAVIVHEPRVASLPLVLDSPHSGERYPDDFDPAPPLAVVRQAEDTHVARLWLGALDHGATLVEATFPARTSIRIAAWTTSISTCSTTTGRRR